jgi:hypothetical protein
MTVRLTDEQRLDLLRRVESHSLTDADQPAVAQLLAEGLVAMSVRRKRFGARKGEVVRETPYITDAGAALLNRFD